LMATLRVSTVMDGWALAMARSTVCCILAAVYAANRKVITLVHRGSLGL
jgi:hypothetical protein